MTDAEVAASRIGTTLCGKWTLEKLLGVGGMASVYVGRHKIGRLDAIKILHPDVAASKQLRARFEQEAHVVNRFKHPGAVEIRDIDVSEEGAPFLVMELLEGKSLAELVRRDGPLPVDRVLRIADEVLDVLGAAHAQGIVHRDIKPDNLFVLTSGSVKVLDFGIARFRAGAERELKTRTGTTLGTTAYMPPEQATGVQDLDGRADVYAVGATMFRVLSNRRVHEADSEAERLVKVVTEKAAPLASVAPQVPPEVCAIVDRALAFDRRDRYPDAPSMQADVRAVLAGKPIAPVPARVDDQPTAAERRAADAPTAATAPSPAPPADAVTRAAPGIVHEVPTVNAEPPPSALAASAVAREPTTFMTDVRERPLLYGCAAAGIAVFLVAICGLGVFALVSMRTPSQPDPSPSTTTAPVETIDPPSSASAVVTPPVAPPVAQGKVPVKTSTATAAPPPAAPPPAAPPPAAPPPATPPQHGHGKH